MLISEWNKFILIYHIEMLILQWNKFILIYYADMLIIQWNEFMPIYILCRYAYYNYSGINLFLCTIRRQSYQMYKLIPIYHINMLISVWNKFIPIYHTVYLSCELNRFILMKICLQKVEYIYSYAHIYAYLITLLYECIE